MVQRSVLPPFVLAIISALLICIPAGDLSAQPASGTLLIYGDTYSFSGIDLTTTDFQGSDPLYTSCGGGGLGFYLGASPAEDRLYICDETGGGGENAAMLIGCNPSTYVFDAASATLDYLAYTSGTDGDPMGIDWVTDAHPNPGNDNDINVRVLLPRGGTGETAIVVALDRDGYDGTGTHFADWSTVSDSDDMTGFNWVSGSPEEEAEGRATASCTDNPASPTRMYVGGVKIVDDTKHFAYQVLDLSTNDFLSPFAVYLDQIGTPDEPHNGWEANRDLRGLGSDGVHFFAAVRKPGVDELWLYRFDSFPDPSATEDTDRLGGLPASASLAVLTYPSGERYDRTGFTCGRRIDVEGQLRPVFYVLCEYYLYTLVPIDVVDRSGVEGNWDEYR